MAKRSLFDASRMAGPPDPEKKPGDDAWTVTALAQRIDGALRSGLPTKLRVVGEVSRPNLRTHWYFTMKDDDAAIDCVMFASDARAAKLAPEHGDRVIAAGRVQHYAKQGRTQLYVESLEPAGKGPLEAQLRALIDELRAEGYFDDEHKQPLPTFPQRIAVITSRTGAALQDVIDTMRRRAPGVALLVVDTRMQGEGAGARIADIVAALDERAEELAIDAFLITRGGGSVEDLWCFNDRDLADAIWDCALPVVCEIGHETDTTVCELVADRRCATPTQAAMALTPDREALLEQLALTKSRLRAANASLVRTATRESRRSSARLRTLDPARPHAIALRNAAQAHRARARSRLTSMHLALERLAGRLASNKPESVHAERSSAVNRAASRLRRAVRARLDAEHLDRRHTRLASVARRELRDQRTALDALERELVLVSPASVLARGYSLTTRADTGTLVRTPADAHPGDRLVTRLGAGTLRSVVEGEGVTETAAPAPKLPPRRRRRTKRDTPGQMGLF